MPLTYDPSIFAVPDERRAREIILTGEGASSAARWETETPYLADVIARTVPLSPQTLLLDYGCGIGRLAKEMIARHNCTVIGVDISPDMRALAPSYVKSDRFTVCSPEVFHAMCSRGLRFDAALAIWVLQHCFDPVAEVAAIAASLKSAGHFFVLNNSKLRVVPTKEVTWANDGVDVWREIEQRFRQIEEGVMPEQITPPTLIKAHCWRAYTRIN
jgi:SAM-dependent methyltransferase